MSRVALLVTGALFVGVWMWSWTVLPPDGVAQQVGPDGVSRDGSRAGLLVPLGVIAVVLVAALAWLPGLAAARAAPESISYPWRDYWMAPERRAQFARMVTGQFEVLAAGVLVLSTVGLLELVSVTLESGRPSLMVPALAGFAGFFVLWCLWVLRQAWPAPERSRAKG